MPLLDRFLRRLGIVRASSLGRNRDAGVGERAAIAPSGVALGWADTIKLKPLKDLPPADNLAEGTQQDAVPVPVEAVEVADTARFQVEQVEQAERADDGPGRGAAEEPLSRSGTRTGRDR